MTVQTIAWLLGLVVASQFLGVLIVPLGQLGYRNGVLGEEQKMKRSKIVGETGNPLLIDICRDAHTKVEIATGVMGLLIYCIIVVFLSSTFSGELQASSVETPRSNRIETLPAIILGVATSIWLRHSVSETLMQIDRIIQITGDEGRKSE